MKLILQNDRIAATATDDYEANGLEQAVVDAPADFDIARIDQYRYLGGALAIAVPESVPMLNAHLALIAAGKLDQLLALVAAMEPAQQQAANAYLNLAQTCRRDNALVAQLGPGIGLDEAGLDQLFIAAAGIVA